MLKVEELHGGYGGAGVLHGVNLRVSDGEAVVILGPNGHGKTTLLRSISGLVQAAAGTIEFDDQDLTHRSADAIAAAGIIHIPQGDLLFAEMTVLENLLMGAYLKKAWGEREAKLGKVFELFPWLEERKSQLARSLSGGERRMLAIGRGLMGWGRLLLIDEPSLGLAPVIIDQVYSSIRAIKESGLSILLVDENANHAEGLADRVYLLETGMLVREGAAAQLLRDEALLAAYLG